MSISEHPPEVETDDSDWQNGQGETPDTNALAALQLAHRALEKFPELRKRYQKYVGPVAVLSTAAVVLASIAVSRRLHHGQSIERILAEITPEEIENIGKEKRDPTRKPRGITRFLR